MVATIKIIGDKEISRAFKAAGKVYAKDRKKVMTAILRSVVVPAVKRQVKSVFKDKGRRRKFAIPQRRLVTLPSRLGVVGEVFPKFAPLSSFETGEDRVAKKGKSSLQYFKVPLTRAHDASSADAKTFIRKSKRGNLIIFRRDRGAITPLFILKKRLKTPKRPFLGPAAEKSAPTVAERLGDAYIAAVNRA